MITFDEKLEAAWGLHKIEKAVLEKEIAELKAENEKLRELLTELADEYEQFAYEGAEVALLREARAAAAIRESGDE